MSTTTKVRKNTKTTIRYTKGKKEVKVTEKYDKDDDYQIAPSTTNKKKGKSFQFTNKKKGGIINKKKPQKKVDLLKLITSWIFPDSNVESSPTSGNKKNQKKNQGAWTSSLSWGSQDTSKKNKKKGSQDSWISSLIWDSDSKKKKGQKKGDSWLSSITSWAKNLDEKDGKQKKKKN